MRKIQSSNKKNKKIKGERETETEREKITLTDWKTSSKMS